MTKVLLDLYAASGGGVEQMLYRYLTHMDRRGLHFDLAVCTPETGAMEEQFRQLGCEIFHLPRRRTHFRQHCAAMAELLRRERYDIVHSHQSEYAFITMLIAKRCGVPARLMHCHIAYPPESLSHTAVRRLGAVVGKVTATHYLACSTEAGMWLFGDRAVRAGNVRVVPNAMDLGQFVFSEQTRREQRSAMGLEGKLVLGCVGRLEEQKNHALLLEIFAEIRKRRQDTVLLLVGDGKLRAELEEQARQLGVASQVRFLGIRMDVPQLLCAMDAYVMPSLYEGLGIVFVEAQAAGLPTFCMDVRGVQSACVTAKIHPVPAGTAAAEWAERVLSQVPAKDRDMDRAALAGAGFEITEQAPALEAFYRALAP